VRATIADQPFLATRRHAELFIHPRGSITQGFAW
jgi:hypothetical protein